ncbi:hypothetical protein [Gluconacetobacter diazotrophicus]|uniref:Uncharacterized protein n=1 Tax=Gluconacetobacter diazotrophicus (strain ATCC 49037 / DSM 5601 / CCUG 37298 / CIP 103539 / LMG 7603 / PAl5) TaxID=272568 RepID=A9HD15_GLUDA|nr:hypothetical protein [Gluconacetobacter diazotrophicus]CAP55031.1 hypothetical protein GDI1088 [Gluconacetobacter diazotrophicus PA1 5]
MNEVTKTVFGDKLFSDPVALISCLSFEERSLAVAKSLINIGLTRWLCIINEDIETDISSIHREALRIAERAGVTIEFLKASKRNPLLLADAMIQLAGNAQLTESEQWVADITTMTHEMLLIILAAADEIVTQWKDLSLVYNVAAQYSGDDEPGKKWISQGIHDVRTVIGYPGNWSPGKHTVLVALPGFDSERMQRMVEEIEPEQLIVGIACPVGDHHAWSATKNREIARQLLMTRKGSTFDYPALEPFGMIDALIRVLRDIKCNVLLAPLNSKISTAALGVLARNRPEWQICYAPAFIYNLNYATPSNTFLTCSLKALTDYARSALAMSDSKG